MVAGLALWWEHLPSTNVARVRFPHPVSYVDWVCWFSTLLWEVFPRVFRFSPLIKNQHLIWFVNNDCKNNYLGSVDLISSRIVKRIWKLNCWICAIEINVIIIIFLPYVFSFFSLFVFCLFVSLRFSQGRSSFPSKIALCSNVPTRFPYFSPFNKFAYHVFVN